MSFQLIEADCIQAMAAMEEASVDAIVTDPPYGIGFMGHEWDQPGVETTSNGVVTQYGRGHYKQRASASMVAGEYDQTRKGHLRFQQWCEAWAIQAFRVLKPGGHLLCFGGTRTYHRMAAGLEDAGFEIRDCLAWLYGQGFPKSLNLKGCKCQEGESTGGREAVSEYDLRPMRDTNLQTAVNAADQQGEALLAGVSQQGLPPRSLDGTGPAHDGRVEPGLEGRSDTQEAEGELSGSAVRASAGVGPADGPEGRLHHGASASDGADVRAAALADGSGEPHRPQPGEQRPEQPGTVADERGPQARRGWPLCPRCGEPRGLNGWGTALKPSFEPVVLARKPLIGSVAQNVLEHGTGALNIDGTRIEYVNEEPPDLEHWKKTSGGWKNTSTAGVIPNDNTKGRWPPNVLLDEEAAAMLDEQSGETSYNPAGQFGTAKRNAGHLYGGGAGLPHAGQPVRGFGDRGGASRFFTVVEPARCPSCGGRWVGDPGGTGEPCSDPFHADNPNFPTRFRYLPKADREERNRGLLPGERSTHPTVKPVELMQWLVRLVTPPKGLVLDPFAGSGSTLIAACREGFDCIGIEREPEYVAIARDRVIGDGPLFNVEAG